MSDTTANLNMPFILPSQAQKHVTHNEALLRLDALVHLTVVAEQAEPPVSAVEGSCYLVAGSPAGLWTGKQGCIAAWQDGAWSFSRPKVGWRVWFISSARLKVFTGSSWQDIPLPQEASFDRLGVGAAPDNTNRFVLSSPASLFNHAGNGHQVKVNKASASDTASLLFQSNWTGHAEMGLAGNNEFSIKVSDGANWKTALALTGAGHVSRPNQPTARAYRTGTSFSPTPGQQSGFTTLAFNQGGFALGATAANSGNALTIPASGLYLVALNIVLQASSAHEVTLLLNGSQILLSVSGPSGDMQTRSASGVFFFFAGNALTLGHSGTVQIQTGSGKTELSLAML
ncbi:DUF2793 domain-containing protein [Rhizobium deserti]|uniref:DUF2793 domain-containing protein n=1 Tax=Rhizobium deserti TaxID=2547961 RepID=A0A4R5UNF5_9HYPH|nr:DUF2793 domain-containing protein [Rhizobium deserti]TDK39274.1 DUF2793 domain-containing protein [Rhizobium deserti]